jgi:type IV pilus assembly protein PilF
MKSAVQLLMVLLLVGFLNGCASQSSPSSQRQPRAQVPTSQEAAGESASRTRAKGHTDLGFEYYAQRQLGTALQEAKIALKDDSSYTPAYNLLALVYMGLGERKSAEDAFQRALQLSPGDPEIANNYGWFLCQNKREAQAFEYFNIALRNPLYPTPVVALANSAECATQIGNYKDAEASLTRALAMNPDSTRVLLAMANVKYQQGQLVEARYFLGELHKNIEPNAASASLALRIARRTDNREDEARYLSLLRKKFSDSAEYKRVMEGAPE